MTPTNDDVTLAEVNRNIGRLFDQLLSMQRDVDTALHGLRNKQQATDVRLAVLANEIKNIKGVAALISTFIGASVSALIAWFKK